MKATLFFITITVIILYSLQEANAQWQLTGNAGTNPASNFLGTTDAKTLVFRTANVARMRIMGSGDNAGYVGIGSPSPVQRLDVNGNINIALNSGLYINNRRVISTNGTANFFGGTSSGYTNTGSFNTGIGGSAFYYNTGSYNAAVGYRSLGNNTSGNENSAFGSQALFSNTTGPYNTATGFKSMFFNSMGDHNTATGYQSLYSNQVGGLNTASGAFALYSNTGNQNTASGFQAMQSNTGGVGNAAFGAYAAHNNISGWANVAFGFSALHGNVTGWDNTAIGAYANVKYPNLTNATAIGFDAVVDDSYKVRIGDEHVKIYWRAGGMDNIF